jgi:hypothetical protein
VWALGTGELQSPVGAKELIDSVMFWTCLYVLIYCVMEDEGLSENVLVALSQNEKM